MDKLFIKMAKLKKDGTPKMSGGKREYAGNKPKYDEPLKLLQRKVPISKYAEIAKHIDDYLSKFRANYKNV